MRLQILAFASIAVAGMGLASLATPAQAAEPGQAAEKDRHCVVTVSSTTCYDTFTEAIAKATGGRVTDAPDNSQAAVKDPRLAARLNASSPKKDSVVDAVAADVLIAIEYEDSDFEGSTYTVTRPWGCTTTLNDIDWEVANLPFGWTIRSYRTFSNCWAKHYEHANFEGRSAGWDGGGNLPFDPKSIQWS